VDTPKAHLIDEDRGDDVAADPLDRVIGGRYRLVRVLGEGGMGSVYEAEHLQLGSRVAIKLLRGDAARDPQAVERLLREARAAASVRHPHIVRVLDVGHDAGGAPYIVQELLVGRDLRRRLDVEKKLSAREALEVVIPVLGALDAAHHEGVVHRDIKPENIFLAEGEDAKVTPRVIDFGVSRFTDKDRAPSSLTRTGALVGTPYYMAPEQARGERTVGPAADVWAVGVLLYESLAGKRPFDADNHNALMVAVLTARVPPLAEVAPEVPAWLAEVTERALDRERRYTSAREFMDALASQNAPTVRPVEPPKRRVRNALAICAGLALATLGAITLSSRASPTTVTDVPAPRARTRVLTAPLPSPIVASAPPAPTVDAGAPTSAAHAMTPAPERPLTPTRPLRSIRHTPTAPEPAPVSAPRVVAPMTDLERM
jgi:serine/threonine-protein kinase